MFGHAAEAGTGSTVRIAGLRRGGLRQVGGWRRDCRRRWCEDDPVVVGSGGVVGRVGVPCGRGGVVGCRHEATRGLVTRRRRRNRRIIIITGSGYSTSKVHRGIRGRCSGHAMGA